MVPADRQHLQDFEFVMDAKQVAREYGCSVLFVTHPPKCPPKAAPALERLAGGAAYSRFSQTILCMEKHRPYREARVGANLAPVRFNRSLHVAKARNGRGGGFELAYQMEGGTLRFCELGAVAADGGRPPE
jgi:hypothetical protein